MRWRVQVLTPTLVGDGQRLSPIDYMVWRDQVNVLDQRRIFRLLARGPRLEGYLSQLRRAEKLDFASWGGFAQNFAGRRIPFEHSSLTAIWQKARPEELHIPTFCSGPAGPYLPASALKGALRTAFAHQRFSPTAIRELAARMQSERVRNLGAAVEGRLMGGSVSRTVESLALSDSAPVASSLFRIYLLRLAKLASSDRRQDGKFYFAEMAPPGTQFSGTWNLPNRRSLRSLLDAANAWSADLLAAHARFAEAAALPRLSSALASLRTQLETLHSSNACLLCIGFGGGFLSKAAYTDTDDPEYRKILGSLPYYQRSLRPNLPFPKTRKIVHLQGEPATLPGWVLLELLETS
jgi:CRISPR-associated protein Csm5